MQQKWNQNFDGEPMTDIPQKFLNARCDVYLDGGFANAKEFIHRFILNDMEHKKLFYDSKTILQEIVQGHTDETLTYVLLKEEGPDHNKSFEVSAMLDGQEIGRGIGRTKKSAEQRAAYRGILTIRKPQE